MSSVRGSLATVFSGAIALLFGYVLGGLLTLGTKVLLARAYEGAVYGVFSQALGLVMALVMLAMLGMNVGVARYISYHQERAEEAITSALVAAVPVAVVVFGGVYLAAPTIAARLFGDPGMTDVLRLFAVAGPFMVTNSILISGFRGFSRSSERVALVDFIIPGVQVLAIGAVVWLGRSVTWATGGFITGYIVGSVVIVAWYLRDHRFHDPGLVRELFSFSWPLMVSSVAVQAFLWAPFILLGVLDEAFQVGLLNAALPLAAASKMVLSSLSFLFLPEASKLASDAGKEELSRLYRSTTWWIVAATLPVLAFLAVRPTASLGFVFGTGYTDAAAALVLLALGYLINAVTGPVGNLLIAVGETHKEMWANIGRLALTGALAVWLIPDHGVTGMAAAYAVGMATGNLLRFIFCMPYVGRVVAWRFIYPPLALAAALLALPGIEAVTGFLPLQAVAFAAVYLTALLLTRPLDADDRGFIGELVPFDLDRFDWLFSS